MTQTRYTTSKLRGPVASYTFFVRSHNSFGSSVMSNNITFQYLSATPPIGVQHIPLRPSIARTDGSGGSDRPMAPHNVQVHALSATVYNVSWMWLGVNERNVSIDLTNTSVTYNVTYRKAEMSKQSSLATMNWTGVCTLIHTG